MHQLRVINIDAFHPVQNVQNVCWATNKSFFDWAMENNYAKTDWGHFFLDAHQDYADLVVANLTTDFQA
jgi:hypothetical protein